MCNESRVKLECVIILSYADNSLSKIENQVLNEIIKEFSKDGEYAFNLMQNLVDTQSYEENYFILKVSENCKAEFLKILSDTQKIANLAPILYEYVKCVKLDRQEALGEYILKSTKSHNVLDLDLELLDSYKFSATREEYKTFEKARLELKETYSIKKYPTAIEFLDTAFDGGIETGQLILISGDPEAGKTTLSTQLIENISHNSKVCFFCFEFTLAKYVFTRQKYPNELFNQKNMIVFDYGYDIREICVRIKEIHKDLGCEVFLIDSQMRIENNRSGIRSGEEKESEKFELLGKLAHSLQVIIIVIIQTSKSDPNTPFNSKKGAHEASAIFHLANIESKNPLDKIEKKLLTCIKNKQTGKHFKEEVWLDKSKGQFIKDPNHKFKNKEFNPKKVINKEELKQTLDLVDFPDF